MKYWDEETAFRRDIYDINKGRAFGTLVDDLKKAPTFDKPNNDATEKGMATPESIVQLTNRVISLEKKLRRKCLQDDFDDNADTSESDSMVPSASDEEELNYSDNNTSKSNEGTSVAATVKQNRRKRQTPKKYKSPVIPIKAVGRRSHKTDDHANKKAKHSAGKEVLTPQRNAVVHYINTNYSSNKMFERENLFRHNRSGIPANEIICLTLPSGIKPEEKYLSTHVIDAYTQHILQPRFGDTKILCPVHYSMIVSDHDAGRYNNPVSQRFIHEVATTLFSHDKVFMPFHVQRDKLVKHWIVVVIMNRKHEFQILDSLGWELQLYQPQLMKLIDGIVSAAKTVPTGPTNVGSWEIVRKKNLPMQEDGYSCGLYSIKFMELWNGSRLSKRFTQADIDKFRPEMAAELILAEANQAQDVKAAVQALMKEEDHDDAE